MSFKFAASNPYLSARQPVFARNVVATSHALAAQAGLHILRQGGNAVDAAIATAAAMTVVEPVSNGLGSDAFALVWDGRQLHGLNASGRAPRAWSLKAMAEVAGKDATAPPKRGWHSVTVPGAVSAWSALSRRLGRLAFEDLMQPAIDMAERGVVVPMIVAQKWAAAVPLLAQQPGFAEAFMPRGRAPAMGERFQFQAAARTLSLIAKTHGEDFYQGEVAAAIAAHAAACGGWLSPQDLAEHRVDWVDPIGTDYLGYRLHEIPPNGQGIAALMALGMLRSFDMAAWPVDSVMAQHLQIEAMKLAFADAYAHVADARSMRVTSEQLLDPTYLAERARLIDVRRAQDFHSGNPSGGGTIYLTAADEQGMMVSLIQSNYMGFGSGVVVPGYGVSMQNRGHGFSLQADHPNVVAPGKRPFHTIIPAFVTQGGAPVMSFGVMGGNMQPQGHLQTLLRMVQYQQHPQAACDAPRWRFNQGLSLNVESSMPAATVEGLRALGHQLEPISDSYQDFGAGQFIWRLGDPGTDGYVAASDPRRDGQAVGY